MRIQRLWPVAIILAVLVVLLDATLYEVNTGQYAVVTSFGRVVQGRVGPGLHVKLPFLQHAHVFDGRLLNLRVEPEALLTQGHKRVLVDAFLEYRVVNFRRYLASTAGSRHKAEERLRQAAITALRGLFGESHLAQVLAGQRTKSLAPRVAAEVARYGLTVVDLKIQRIGLADRVNDAIDKRMAAKELMKASQIEAQGMAQAQVVRAQADQKRAEILAQAAEQAAVIRGQAQAQAGTIDTKAYGRDPGFFVFYRSLRAYIHSFANRGTTLVLGPQSGFLRFLPDANPYRK